MAPNETLQPIDTTMSLPPLSPMAADGTRTPPPRSTAATAPSTPTLRDRLTEKTSLLLSTLSAVNSSKDKRAAVSGVVSDLGSHVRSRSISGLSSLAGGLGSWGSGAASVVLGFQTPVSVVDAPSAQVPPGLDPHALEETLSSTVARATETARDNDDAVETTDSNTDDYEDANDDSSSDERNDLPSTSTTVRSPKRSADKIPIPFTTVVPKKSAARNLDYTTPRDENTERKWKRETEQSFHILSLGLSQLGSDPQLGRTLAVHGLGRLAGAVLSELEASAVDETASSSLPPQRGISEQEHQQLLVACLTPLLRGRSFSIEMTPEKDAGFAASHISEVTTDSSPHVLAALRDAPFYSPPPSSSSHSSPKRVASAKRMQRRPELPPAVYEPQNAAERAVVTGVRAGCLALKTALPYARELATALAAEERRLRISERVAAFALRIMRATLFCAAAIFGSLRRAALESGPGRRAGRALHGIALAFAVALGQAVVIMAASSAAPGENGGAWRSVYYERDDGLDIGYEEDEEEDGEETGIEFRVPLANGGGSNSSTVRPDGPGAHRELPPGNSSQPGAAGDTLLSASSITAATSWTAGQLEKLWAAYSAQQAHAHAQLERQRVPRANPRVKTHGPKRS